MAAPTEYLRGTNFADAQAAAPSVPPNGAAMDGEFDRIKNALDQTQNSLGLIQRDDGALANGVVTLDSLSTEIGAAIQPAVPWQQGVNFAANATVFYSDGTDVGYYRALAAHTSSSDFDADEALGLWLLLADFTPPSVVGTVGVDSGGTGATTAAGARTNLGLGVVATRSVVPVTEGGTGATSASAARTALGVSIGSTVQAYSAQLDTLAAFNTNGLLTQTGAGTFAGRTITGDANIAITNGNGVSGNPVVAPQGNLATLLGQFASLQTLVRSLSIVALDSNSPTPDMAEGFQFSRTWTGNGTVANPTNAAAGMSIALYITQDGTGGRTVGFGSNWIFRGTPTIDPAPNSVTMVVGSFLAPDYIIARIV